jgi:CheY-like chemotaxis protein
LLQEDAGQNAAVQEDIAEILKSASRAKDLVQQILTFTRQRESSRQVVRLDTIIKEAMKILRASLPAQINIETRLAPEAPTVLADPTQIYQVTMNLATNALHAMEGGAGQLTITLESFQPDEAFVQAHPQSRRVQHARLSVTDTGHGMDASTLERIFDPFFTTKPVGKGTGLGLSVVHGIMQSHEGVITVESELGKGTIFRLYFPAQTHNAAETSETAGKLSNGRGERILVVDDEPALTASLQRALGRWNYEVTISNQPHSALSLFQQNPAQFDLLITDLSMREMTGLELARQIHALRPDLPIILASGFVPDLKREDLRAAGIDEMLEKPLSMTALIKTIQRVLA